MNIRQIREKLEYFHSNPHVVPMNERFQHDAYFADERCCAELTMVKHPMYMVRLAGLIAELNPISLLTIGALYGTTESYLLQTYVNCQRRIGEITICDVDLADYNPNRDNGSIVYRNICGTCYAAFGGVFTHIRGSSREPEVMRRIRACGPYDVIFVDGEHSADAVFSDLSLAAECLRVGGTILVHDTCLYSSSVPAGWQRWAKEHSPEWTCDAVDDTKFFMGLGFVQRTVEQ